MISDNRWAHVEDVVDPLRQAVLVHPIYQSLRDRRALQLFMEHHVWAVWDFMSVLTRLQRDLTCVGLPWVPRPVDAAVQRMINEIKMGEESDEHPDGGYTSHFSLYLEAMEEVGADIEPVRRAVVALASASTAGGRLGSVTDLMIQCGAPAASVEFVSSTFDLVENGSTLEVAAAFALGREELIPDMFTHLVNGSDGRLLVAYLQRHVELDEGEHGPLAHRLVEQLAGDDAASWYAVERAAAMALGARARLWDGVVVAIEGARVMG